jgi:hypothetical protein
MDWEADQARMPAVRGLRSRDGGVGSGQHLHRRSVNVAYGISTRPHGRARGGRGGSIGSGDAVLSHSARTWCSTGSALTAITRARGRGGGLVEFLLVTQKEVPPSEASCTLWTFKGLLFCVRPLMALQMFQSSEWSQTCRADMRPRLVGLGWGESGRSFRIHSYGRACYATRLPRQLHMSSYEEAVVCHDRKESSIGNSVQAYRFRRWRWECSQQRRQAKRMNWTWRQEFETCSCAKSSRPQVRIQELREL